MYLIDKIGDLLGARRCSNCRRTLWMHGDNSHILYQGDESPVTYCNRCIAPAEEGRLYRVDCVTNSLVPVNETAYEFELKRAGQPGALYEYPWDVPEPEDVAKTFLLSSSDMRGQW